MAAAETQVKITPIYCISQYIETYDGGGSGYGGGRGYHNHYYAWEKPSKQLVRYLTRDRHENATELKATTIDGKIMLVLSKGIIPLADHHRRDDNIKVTQSFDGYKEGSMAWHWS